MKDFVSAGPGTTPPACLDGEGGVCGECVECVECNPHDVEACYDDGEGRWSLVCSCQWEAWGYATEQRVRQIHAAHKLDPTADKPVTVTA